jgi:hypothetical protein
MEAAAAVKPSMEPPLCLRCGYTQTDSEKGERQFESSSIHVDLSVSLTPPL